MMRAFTAFGLIVAWSAMFCVALHYGQKWVDRMLHYKLPDPSKPIVRRSVR